VSEVDSAEPKPLTPLTSTVDALVALADPRRDHHNRLTRPQAVSDLGRGVIVPKGRTMSGAIT
jgi:hypothetical protein